MIAGHDQVINVVQGDFEISDRPNVILTTVLGSCVAVCLYDPVRQIGGMNHFLLPYGDSGGGVSMRYGTYAMELLINGLLKKGARKERLEAKVFGGARMNEKLRDIGSSNAAFAKEFLAEENIPIIAESLAGNAARRIRQWPTTGRVRQLLVENPTEIPVERPAPMPRTPKEDITLF
ncbi:chemotaxis protein CheD [Citreimonas salinaria]|uniref:Probable chemoreceptor glutamine deamidase CheD n=1 Tax=Citreimonas salinaria TaxID=321339 RepID=A0A1H3JHT9_9RHOB|nr:chemotaxis protein CheD [Citreimonas salinaria]SDY38794.1 chemotaxis protein CheD [Citreimonas salinaria]